MEMRRFYARAAGPAALLVLSGCAAPGAIGDRVLDRGVSGGYTFRLQAPVERAFPPPVVPRPPAERLPTKLRPGGGGLSLIVGDSIAKGTGAALGVRTVARESMSSCWIAARTPSFSGAWAVISAGINDPPGSCIEAIRARVRALRVVWILPAPINSARAHVKAVAAAHGDRTVSYACVGGCSTTNFHPASYDTLAAEVRATLGDIKEAKQ